MHLLHQRLFIIEYKEGTAEFFSELEGIKSSLKQMSEEKNEKQLITELMSILMGEECPY